MHRLMAAHSTHQAYEESGKTTKMTAGVMPHCETAHLPARRFGRPPESAHPLLRGQPSLMEIQETIARVPLASGLLAGKFKSDSEFDASDHRQFNRHGEAFDVGETFSGVPYEAGSAAVEEVRPLVPKGTTMAQFALAVDPDERCDFGRHPRGQERGAGAQQHRRSSAFVFFARHDGAHSIDLRNKHQALGAPAMVKAQRRIRRRNTIPLCLLKVG
jgi:hypothetical protein